MPLDVSESEQRDLAHIRFSQNDVAGVAMSPKGRLPALL
jgi:hypothetical protein